MGRDLVAGVIEQCDGGGQLSSSDLFSQLVERVAAAVVERLTDDGQCDDEWFDSRHAATTWGCTEVRRASGRDDGESKPAPRRRRLERNIYRRVAGVYEIGF